MLSPHLRLQDPSESKISNLELSLGARLGEYEILRLQIPLRDGEEDCGCDWVTDTVGRRTKTQGFL